MQLGFVIDHSRCIGCHACTVACKSENHVPLGSFRTWVKYTEEGEFPAVERSFAVLRCNQCSDAPCVTICPVSALEKRFDGVVDVDPKACIGCKACMHGCPYDALYIHPGTGTAEKCHFCVHRTELGLAPACAVVCPTEAIVPGDFDDPASRVSRMRAELDLRARKTEAGTRPNVLYREVSAAGIDPAVANMAGGFIWTESPSGPRMDAQMFEALEGELETRARARTTYDVPRGELWGGRITGYLFFKSLAAGLFPAAWLSFDAAAEVREGVKPGVAAPLFALVCLTLTCGLLVGDLKRPERFFFILKRPNWRSWLARGTFAIGLYGALLAVWLLAVLGRRDDGGAGWAIFGWLTIATGLLTAAYTGWLFRQARGRVLWMKRGYWFHLVVQALLAGSALLCALQPVLLWGADAAARLADLLSATLVLHLVLVWIEERMAPRGREAEYRRAARLVTHGPYSRRHWALGVVLGILLPMLLILVYVPLGGVWLPALAGVLALAGLWHEKDVFVRAGQALPIS